MISLSLSNTKLFKYVGNRLVPTIALHYQVSRSEVTVTSVNELPHYFPEVQSLGELELVALESALYLGVSPRLAGLLPL